MFVWHDPLRLRDPVARLVLDLGFAINADGLKPLFLFTFRD